jgi:putative hydrolase of the HAD superfamily
MVAAITRIRDAGLRTAALTNNWAADEGAGDTTSGRDDLTDLFDVVVESAVVGLRKPDPRIYELVCSRLAVAPEDAVFLDDLGVNLRPARALGMHTIKVVDPDRAIAELGGVLGLPLATRTDGELG